MLLGAVTIGVTLWSWGQPPISKSGEVRLWVNSIWSQENSQQIADWYALSHFIHGLLMAFVGLALRRWIGFPAALVVAVITGVAWEVIEHTDLVMTQFRSQTIYKGYSGDSVLNAVCDYAFMLGGFFLGSAVPVAWSLLLILVLEVVSTLAVREGLVLTTIRVVHPVAAITAWQDELKPPKTAGAD
jgi:hypothetical protein